MWLLANNQGVNVKLDSVGKFATDDNKIIQWMFLVESSFNMCPSWLYFYRSVESSILIYLLIAKTIRIESFE